MWKERFDFGSLSPSNLWEDNDVVRAPIVFKFNGNVCYMDYKLAFEQLLKSFHERHVRY